VACTNNITICTTQRAADQKPKPQPHPPGQKKKPKKGGPWGDRKKKKTIPKIVCWSRLPLAN